MISCQYSKLMSCFHYRLWYNKYSKTSSIWSAQDHKIVFQLIPCFLKYGKGKANSAQAWTGPDGSRGLMPPDFKTISYEGGKIVSPMYQLPLPPRKYSWYSLLWEDRAIVQPEGSSMKNSSNTIRNRTRYLSACSAMPQPTALQRAHFLK